MGRQLDRRLSDASCDETVLGKAFAEDKSSPEKVDAAENNLFKEFFERGIPRYYDPGKWQNSENNDLRGFPKPRLGLT